MKAEEAILGFAFSQAGADAGKVAVGGTFAYFKQDSDTLAQLAEGSVITGGRVDVYAGSLETQINWAGGVAKSKAIGAGIAVAITVADRKTRAVIGELDDTAGTGANGLLTINIVGALTARASVAGGLYTFTVAGAFANATPSKDTPNASGGGTGTDHDRSARRTSRRRSSSTNRPPRPSRRRPAPGWASPPRCPSTTSPTSRRPRFPTPSSPPMPSTSRRTT